MGGQVYHLYQHSWKWNSEAWGNPEHLYSLDILLSHFGTSCCSMSGSNCCFLSYIQISYPQIIFCS